SRELLCDRPKDRRRQPRTVLELKLEICKLISRVQDALARALGDLLGCERVRNLRLAEEQAPCEFAFAHLEREYECAACVSRDMCRHVQGERGFTATSLPGNNVQFACAETAAQRA